MSLFFGKSKSTIGIDIGSSSIKLVELETSKGKANLVTYGYLTDLGNLLSDGSIDATKKIASFIKTLHKHSGAKSLDVFAAVPNYTVFSSILTLPKTSKGNVESLVIKEASKLLPMPVEEMMLDWRILGDNDRHGSAKGVFSLLSSSEKPMKASQEDDKFVRVLLIATSKKLVKRYVDIFKMAGLHLMSVETEPFALTRCLLGKDPSTVIFVDMGGITTDICLVSEGIPLMSRSINVGGNIFTAAINRFFGVDRDVCEQFKIDLSHYPHSFELPEVIKEAAAPTLNELKYTKDLFQSRTKTHPEKIILCGEACLIPGLGDYFSEVLNLKCIIGNPFDRVSYPQGMQDLISLVGTRFSVAAGLAMRNIDT